MPRMKQFSRFKLCKVIPSLNDTRATIPRYEDPVCDKAIIWTITQQMSSNEYGLVVVETADMNYYGKLKIDKNDMIIWNDNNYLVVSVINYLKFTKVKMIPHYVK